MALVEDEGGSGREGPRAVGGGVLAVGGGEVEDRGEVRHLLLHFSPPALDKRVGVSSH